MGQWKIGYVSGLDGVASEDAGKALYDGYSADVLTLDSATVDRRAGRATSVSGTVLTDSGNYFGGSGNYQNGILRMLSGACVGEAFDLSYSTNTTLTSYTNLASEGVATNDFFEVTKGSTTYTFPLCRNPVATDIKRVGVDSGLRFPYYDDGLVVPIGFQADSIVITGKLYTQSDINNLVAQLTHKLDYTGFDAHMSSDDIAPQILETGTHDEDYQTLVWVDDYKFTRHAMRPNVWEYTVSLSNYGKPLLRGY